MADITTISAALSSIKTAVEIAKLLKDSSSSLEQAEVKLKIAEMMGALADAKLELANVQTDLIDRDTLVCELQEKLKTTGKTVGYLSARYLINESGEPTGAPYCPTCWAISKDLMPLTAWTNKEHTHKCGKCGNTIEGRQSPLNVDFYIQREKDACVQIGREFKLVVTP